MYTLIVIGSIHIILSIITWASFSITESKYIINVYKSEKEIIIYSILPIVNIIVFVDNIVHKK